MSRLTKYIEGTACIDGHEFDGCCEVCETVDSCSQCPIGKIIDKLAHYEDLEEVGRLIELPCKVGTEVFFLTTNEKIMSITLGTLEMVLRHGEAIGDGLYLTKAEAERKLAELKGDGCDG